MVRGILRAMQPSKYLAFDPLLGDTGADAMARPGERRELAFTIVDEYVHFPPPRPDSGSEGGA